MSSLNCTIQLGNGHEFLMVITQVRALYLIFDQVRKASEYIKLNIRNGAGFSVDNAESSNLEAGRLPNRHACIEPDIRRASDERIVTKPGILGGILDDKHPVLLDRAITDCV